MKAEMGTAAPRRNGLRRRALGALTAALAALLVAGPAGAHWNEPRIADIEVFDRQDGATLAVYEREGRRYIVGTPGHEYSLRIRNLSGERILAVTSVDGVNVVSGETASPDQSGYVVEGGGTVEIAGWRKSMERTAAFYFTDLGDSYAARTGRPGNVGIIGVAVFRERPRPIAYKPQWRDRIASSDAATARSQAAPAASSEAASPYAGNGAASGAGERQPAPMAQRPEAAKDELADARAGERAAKTMAAPLGTGHGRNESSYATRVAFERASPSPNQTISVQYDRRETLAALGIVPTPSPYYARRSPQPFPGALTFAPDPR